MVRGRKPPSKTWRTFLDNHLTRLVSEAEGYDFERAGARLIARDAVRSVSADTRKRLPEIADSDVLMEDLTNRIIVSSGRNDPEHVRKCEALVGKMRAEFRSEG